MDEIIVFQQAGSGETKINGIRQHGHGLIITKVFDLPGCLPEFIDDPASYFLEDFSGKVVISFLRHADLLDHLARRCGEKKLPLIASGRKHDQAITPLTCCSLGRLPGLGRYGEQFGLPEYQVEVRENIIRAIKVRRGASCGASWEVIPRLLGLAPGAALAAIGREVQYLCSADPSDFDPVSGKSALHVAGKVHAAALEKAINEAAYIRSA